MFLIDLSALKHKFIVVIAGPFLLKLKAQYCAALPKMSGARTAFFRGEERSNTDGSTLSSLTTSPEQSRRTGLPPGFGWEKAGKIFLIINLILMTGCQTVHFSKTDQIKNEDEGREALRSVAGAVRGKPLTDEEVKDLSKQLKNDPQARSAVESITGSISEKQHAVKYCPVDGKRFASYLKECPQHHVPLKELDDR